MIIALRTSTVTWKSLRDKLPAWFVLAISLCGTALAWHFADSATVRDAHLRFEAEIAGVQLDLTERLRAYEQVLHGGVSAFYSWPSVTRENWRRYVANMHISKNYPGIQGIGFAQIVSPAEREAHSLQIRNDGFPKYRVWPEGERAIYTAIIYLEPFDWRNQRAFGYDMFSEPVRRAAMERARDTGLPSLSSKVKLVQETDEAVQAGFLMYLPVYRTVSPADVESRRRELMGYVYSPFRMHDFMDGLLGDRKRNVGLEIFDSEIASDDTLMYSSLSPGALRTRGTPPFIETVRLDLSGRIWTLRFSALPSLRVDRGTPFIVIGGGLLVSVLLSAVTWSLAKNRAQAAAANERLQLDIARREQVEATLREKETSFRYLFEKNPNPMWVFDRSTLYLLQVNDAAVAHYGYSHDEFRQMRITDLRPVEDLPKLISYMQNRPPGLTEAGEWRHIMKNGRTIDVEISSHTLDFEQRAAVLVVARDITESKRAAEALREREADARAAEARLRRNESHLARAQRIASVGSWELDVATGAMLWSEQTYRICGVAPETFTPTLENVLPFVLEEYRPTVRRPFDLVAQGQDVTTTAFSLDFSFRRPDGFIRTFRNEVELVPDERGRISTIIGTVQDVTEVRAAEQGRRELELQLRQTQKMEAIGQLTGGVAHDFNNMLGVVIGNLEHARGYLKDRPEGLECVDDALAGALRGAELVDRLLAFSRKQPLQPAVIDLRATVANLVPLLKRTLGEHITIEAHVSESVWHVKADPVQLENAIINLAINARDAMPDGGRLTLECGNVVLEEPFASIYPDLRVGEYVVVTVSDTGSGMTPDVLMRVFDPFFTTKEVGKGTGLGLSMVHGYMEQSGGSIKIYSEPGQGTAVRLYFPRVQGQAAEARAKGGSDAMVPRGEERILVVEDNPAVRKVAFNTLRSLGYKIAEAENAEAALQALRCEPFDLVFTDVVMPGPLNGVTLARRVRELYPDTQVLLTSGFSSKSVSGADIRGIGVELLAKPYRIIDLARTVRRVLDQDTDGGWDSRSF